MNYSIDVSLDATENYEKEVNDVYGTATDITLNTSMSGNLASGSDKDYYKMVAGADGKISLTFNHVNQNSYSAWKIRTYLYSNGEYTEQSYTYVALKDNEKVNIPAIGAVKDSATVNLPAVGMNQNGIYYIKVESSSDIEGKDYSLLISQGVKKNTDNTTQNQNKTNDQKKNDQSEKGTSLKKGYLYSYCTTGKRSLKLYWSTVSGASGYQIRYSRSKSMTWNVKIKKVSGQSSEQKIITKLSRRKVYYVQIRAYKKLNGKLVYGKWSAKKKLKTK